LFATVIELNSWQLWTGSKIVQLGCGDVNGCEWALGLWQATVTQNISCSVYHSWAC